MNGPPYYLPKEALDHADKEVKINVSPEKLPKRALDFAANE